MSLKYELASEPLQASQWVDGYQRDQHRPKRGEMLERNPVKPNPKNLQLYTPNPKPRGFQHAAYKHEPCQY